MPLFLSPPIVLSLSTLRRRFLLDFFLSFSHFCLLHSFSGLYLVSSLFSFYFFFFFPFFPLTFLFFSLSLLLPLLSNNKRQVVSRLKVLVTCFFTKFQPRLELPETGKIGKREKERERERERERESLGALETLAHFGNDNLGKGVQAQNSKRGRGRKKKKEKKYKKKLKMSRKREREKEKSGGKKKFSTILHVMSFELRRRERERESKMNEKKNSSLHT